MFYAGGNCCINNRKKYNKAVYVNNNNQAVKSCRLPLSQNDRGNYQIRN